MSGVVLVLTDDYSENHERPQRGCLNHGVLTFGMVDTNDGVAVSNRMDYVAAERGGSWVGRHDEVSGEEVVGGRRW